jgi:vesicle coat complex subunit
MPFYDLTKEQRIHFVNKITGEIHSDLESNSLKNILKYFSDDDTYIRKSAYLAIGKIYFQHPILQHKIISLFDLLLNENNFKIRQTVINAAGEIATKDFEIVEHFFDKGLFDIHHAVRNAVIGSMKKSGEKNPVPLLAWAKKHLHHTDKEIRREICHGLELRGRTHPQEILPLLKELQFDKTSRVSKTLVHVIGQISYKKDCLKTVIEELKTWQNKMLVAEAIDEIIDVHLRYKNFSILTQEEAKKYIEETF